MKILSLISVVLLFCNTLYVFKDTKQPNIDYKVRHGVDVFYNQSPVEETQEPVVPEVTWQEKYLDEVRYDSAYLYVIEDITYQGGNLSTYKFFDPRLSSAQEANNLHMYAIINNERIGRWNDIKNTLANGDEVVFFKQKQITIFLDGLHPGRINKSCKLANSDFVFKQGVPFLVQIKYYKVGEDVPSSVWQPIYIPNPDFCNPKSDIRTIWSIKLNKTRLKIDKEKEIQLGKMYFINNQFMDTDRIFEINTQKAMFETQKGDETILNVPYMAGELVEPRIIDWPSGNKYVAEWIATPTPFIKNWQYSSSHQYKAFIVSDFIPKPEFIGKIHNIQEDTDETTIVKYLLHQNNFFNFNVYAPDFNDISVVWGEKQQNGAVQSLTITMNAQNNVKSYNYIISFDHIKEKNKIIAKKQENRQIEIRRAEEKEAEREEMIKREKKKFEQNFTINYQEKSIKKDSGNKGFSLKVNALTKLNRKNTIFFFTLILLIVMGICRKKR